MKKSIATLLLTSTLSVVAMQASADAQYQGNEFILHDVEKQIMTPVVQSKSEAYKMGFEELKVIANKSGYELASKLTVTLGSNIMKSSVHYDSSNVSISEFMNQNGDIVYQGVVNVSFHYQERVYGR